MIWGCINDYDVRLTHLDWHKMFQINTCSHPAKFKIQQLEPWTVKQLESYIRQERDNVLLLKPHQLVLSGPRLLQTVSKRKGGVLSWQLCPRSTFLRCTAALKFQRTSCSKIGTIFWRIRLKFIRIMLVLF